MAIKVNDVVGMFLKLRNDLDTERKKFKAYEAETKEKMAKLEVWLLSKTEEIGVDSFKTQYGTAFRTTKDYARVAGPDGWDLLCEYVIKTKDFGVLEKRVAKIHFKELLANRKITPQSVGVEYVIEQIIQVRKS